MNYTEEQITTMVADRCREALAPLYAQVEELRAKYYPAEPQIERPTPEEVEERELEEHRKIWRKVAEEMRAKGKL